MHRIILLNSLWVVTALLVAGCGGEKPAHKESAHSGHAESGHTESDAHGMHEGEAAGAHEDEIELTPEAMKMAEIGLTKAGIGKIFRSIDLSGEIGFNEDKLVHITPRFAGIVREVRFRVGDYADAGDVMAVIESNESMTQYQLKAPISGRIIEKHASIGEYASEEKSIYVLADLSTVWVNLAVYPKDASKIKTGRKVFVTAVDRGDSAQGTIDYVTPVMDAQTRRITARVVLPNSGNSWRPGAFVKAHIEDGEGKEGLAVDKDAVQILGDKSVVFVSDEPNRFKPVEVVTGESDARRVLILGGIGEGVDYVNKGAFELKAKIVTGSLGAHAGHGH